MRTAKLAPASDGQRTASWHVRERSCGSRRDVYNVITVDSLVRKAVFDALIAKNLTQKIGAFTWGVALARCEWPTAAFRVALVSLDRQPYR